ncbi:MAG: hypothetical protein M1570_01210 [Chloroflexi bacterium]|nr:hypothetical protein [Chloroflexota bacterium]
MTRQRATLRFHDGTQHLVTEQTFPMMRADGDQIRARLRVIIAAQADGFAVVWVGIVLHGR